MKPKTGCSIGTVARVTGLTEHTIRAWERRHAVVTPVRSAGGTRRYREADLDKLNLLATAVRGGHKIKMLAALSVEELAQLVQLDPGEPTSTAGRGFSKGQVGGETVLNALYEASAGLRGVELNRIMTEQFQVLGGRRFAQELAVPLLQRIGSAWMRGELSISAEHLVSTQLRRFLGDALMMASPQPDGLGMIFTTPEGEPHEFGALIAAIFAADEGARVTYLGPDTPPEVVGQAAAQVRADVVAVSVVTLAEGSQRSYFRRLRQCMPETKEIWVGGAAAIRNGDAAHLNGLLDLQFRIRSRLQ